MNEWAARLSAQFEELKARLLSLESKQKQVPTLNIEISSTSALSAIYDISEIYNKFGGSFNISVSLKLEEQNADS